MTHDANSLFDDSTDHWLAYRYLAGECSDTEAVDFETRVATDHALQTALSQAVSLTSVLSQLTQRSRLPCYNRQAPIRSSRAWKIVATTVACALVSLNLLVPANVEFPLVSTSEDASSVVAIWSDLDDDVDDRASQFTDALDAGDELPPSLDVPDWMLVAVHEVGLDTDESDSLEGQPL